MLPPSRAYGPDGDRLVDQVALRSPEAGLALRFIQETGARIDSLWSYTARGVPAELGCSFRVANVATEG